MSGDMVERMLRRGKAMNEGLPVEVEGRLGGCFARSLLERVSLPPFSRLDYRNYHLIYLFTRWSLRGKSQKGGP